MSDVNSINDGAPEAGHSNRSKGMAAANLASDPFDISMGNDPGLSGPSTSRAATARPTAESAGAALTEEGETVQTAERSYGGSAGEFGASTHPSSGANQREVQAAADPDLDGVEITGSKLVSPPRHRQPPLQGGPVIQGWAPPSSGVWPSPSPSTSTTQYPPGQNGVASGSGSTGASSSAPIDLTAGYNPPSPEPHTLDPRKPICIGAIMSKVFSIYPPEIAIIGAQPPGGTKDKIWTVSWRGADLLKVKLKFRAAGSQPRPGKDEWFAPTNDVVQVFTPGMAQYIGDLDAHTARTLIPCLSQGLCRLEGFLQRVQPGDHQYEFRINVLFFTLPSNVNYLVQLLVPNNMFLFDPVPPYDPARHNDNPLYFNGHGGAAIAHQLQQQANNRLFGLTQQAPHLQRQNAVDVQRQQVDEVFKSLDNGAELEQSDPGPWIKTTLFPHQRKALTFLLQREQDWSSLKQARKYMLKRNKRAKDKDAADLDADAQHDADDLKAKAKDVSRSLWAQEKDDFGRKVWVNRITGEKVSKGKAEKPQEGKGAILADDMGLGKTLSVVSLIAATRSQAHKWGKSKARDCDADPADEDKIGRSEIDPSEFKSRIFGMPAMDEDGGPKDKKRKKKDIAAEQNAIMRQGRISRRSKATLLVCPMSTISNWEDQIKEHWDGPVEIVGGAAGVMPPKVVEKKWKPPKKNGESSDESDVEMDELRVYVYHGASRRADPEFIGNFDVVITSYNTLALEFSRQGGGSGTATGSNTNTPGSPEYDLDAGVEPLGDTSLNSRATKPEVDAEIKASEVADALRKAKKRKAPNKASADQTSPLQAIEWFRVVLDEAHYIKTSTTVASQASCDLVADRRVALTGTPIQNRIEDVWALFRFLRLSPIDQKENFTQWISNPCKFGDKVGVARLQLVMRCCTLRRTKDSTTEDGKKILKLPPRTEKQLWLDLRTDEREAYDARLSLTKEKVEEFKAAGELGRNYASVLQEVLRLRQICDHVELARSGAVEEDYDGTIMDYEVAMTAIQQNGLNLQRATSVVCFLKDGAGASCAECGYDYGDVFPSHPSYELGLHNQGPQAPRKKLAEKLRPFFTKCMHIFCPKCFKQSIYPEYSKRMKEMAARSCHACNTMLRLPYDVIEVIPPDELAELQQEQQPKRAARRKYVRPAGEQLNLSTKMQYLHDELLTLSKQNPNSKHYDPFSLDPDVAEMDKYGKPLATKSVVFSQWTTMLDRIQDMLDEMQIGYARLDGTMTREQRAESIDRLRRDKKTEVLLVSTRAGGVGLNLTAASRCYLVDPYWNPSVESQAIDRIHRMGQTRPVIAIKLMINDSIEKRLDEIQRKKANLAQMSLKNMSKNELMAQRAEELADLFR